MSKKDQYPVSRYTGLPVEWSDQAAYLADGETHQRKISADWSIDADGKRLDGHDR